MEATMISHLAFVLSILSFLLAPSEQYDVKLKTASDGFSEYGWVFSHERPYHYFKSTKDIPQSFLPVQHDAIPDRQGVWVLRYKDFSGEPRSFQAERHRSGAVSTSTITYWTKAQLFQRVTIKALVNGDPEFALNSNRNGSPHNDKISLLGQGNCTSSNQMVNGKLQWISYEVKTTLTSQISLDVTIRHPESFVIVDEIIVHMEPFGVPRTKFGKSNDTTTAGNSENAVENADQHNATQIGSCKCIALA